MTDAYVTVKIESLRLQEDYFAINKIVGAIDANNFAKLIDVAGLGANPRESKSNKVTDSITETLERTPELMIFKSKGLLVSTSKCIVTDSHQNLKLSFQDKHHEGVLDGGHNMFAIALFILKKLLKDEKRIKKIKVWHDLILLWKEKRAIITTDELSSFSFKIPIEIIYPKKETVQSKFFDYVSEISSARNNNTQLKESVKADYNGHYDYLKKCLDIEINEKVEWKENEANKSIKRDDIIFLSLIPLCALQREGGLPTGIPKISPVSICTSKPKCIEIFDKIIKSFLDSNTELSEEFKSAMEMMSILPKIHDAVHEKFPELFNKVGRLGNYSPRSDKKKQYKSKFYERELEYEISDGLIYPILFAFCKLMKYEKEQKRLIWEIEPEYFLREKLDDIERLHVVIKKHGYIPGKIIKDSSAYDAMELTFMEKKQ